MKSMGSILHLSDVQFGKLCLASPTDPSDPPSVLRDPLFKELLEALKAWERPDVVVLSGDITTSASPYEFWQAEEFCRELGRLWGSSVPTPVFTVPGNHDVAWALTKLSLPDEPKEAVSFGEDNDSGFRSMRFSPYLSFCSRVEGLSTDQRHPYSLDGVAGFVHWSTVGRMAILGINSACREDYDVNLHAGHIDPWQLSCLEESGVLSSSIDLRVLVLHHHTKPGADGAGRRDFSVCTNSAALSDFVERCKIDLVLHGHRHERSYLRETGTQGHQAHVFGAASLATVPSERGGGNTRCAVHRIDVAGRDSGVTYGLVRTIEKAASGWRPPSDPENPAVFRFGRATTLDDARLHVGRILDDSSSAPHLGRTLERESELYGLETTILRELVVEESNVRGLTATDVGQDLPYWKVFPSHV